GHRCFRGNRDSSWNGLRLVQGTGGRKRAGSVSPSCRVCRAPPWERSSGRGCRAGGNPLGGIGRASGKLILFGEHAAVYGYPAVGVSLSEKITVRLWADGAADWDLVDIAERDRLTIRRILTLLEGLLPELATLSRCKVTVHSEVPRGVGFGSSAALCAALARAALAHAGALSPAVGPGNPVREWELAHGAEK